MEKVLSEDPTRVIDITKKRSTLRIVLSRYVPVAACLAVILLALPYFLNLNRSAYDAAPGSAPVQLGTMTADMDAAGGGMPAPGATPPAPAGAPGGAIPETAGAGGRVDSPALAPTDAPPSPELGGGFGGQVTDDNHTQSSGEAAPVEAEPGEVYELFRNFSAAFAWIEITGEFPEFLEPYEAEFLDDRFIWEMYFEIPRDAAAEFIVELTDGEGVIITYVDDAGDYVMVMYTSGG
jgi:hypothetical protein